MLICFYVDHQIEERFYCSNTANDLTGVCLANQIIKLCLEFELNMNNLVRIDFNEGSNMFSLQKKTQASIRKMIVLSILIATTASAVFI